MIKIAIGPRHSVDRISAFLPGIKAFLNERPDVEVHLFDPSVTEQMLPEGVNGLLLCQPSPDALNWFFIPNMPMVSLQGDLKTPTVRYNHVAGGRMAARFFINHGFKNFGFFIDGTERQTSELRLQGFRETLEAEGFSCDVFFEGETTRQKGTWTYEDQQADLAAWVCQSAKPFAVMCANDQHAVRLVKAAKRAGVSIPDHLAILGILNLGPICELSKPTVSSVHYDSAGMGYAGISWLVEMIESGQKVTEDTIYFQPSKVVERQSTDTFALEDPDVVAALKYIKAHHAETVRVEDVADHVHLSRSSLERRFKEVLGTSPGQYIRQSRIDFAIRLLHEGSMSLMDIAAKCGFSSSSQLSRDIKEMTGKTPTQLRKGQ